MFWLESEGEEVRKMFPRLKKVAQNSEKGGGFIEMPNRDGTGPEGKGALTGRGMGNCKSKKSNRWIQNSRIKKGSFSRQLGIPEKKDIPVTLIKKIKSAEVGTELKNPTKLGKKRLTITPLLKKRANLALNLKRMKRRTK